MAQHLQAGEYVRAELCRQHGYWGPGWRWGLCGIAACLVMSCDRKEKPATQVAKAQALEIAARAFGKAEVPAESPWASREECERTFERAKSAGRRAHGPRVGTWNVRYFPDGSEHDPEGQETDLQWLACAIALLDVDVLAVQEFKKTSRARDSAAELVRQINQRTGRKYRLELSRCDPEQVPHLGMLYDEGRVSVTLLRDVPELNPEQSCTNLASPGFAAYLAFEGGPDFHFLVAHTYAGTQRAEYEKRQAFTPALAAVTGRMQRLGPDRDIVVTGDFNTSGCRDCTPTRDSAEEVRAFAANVAGAQPSLRLVPASESCSFVLDGLPVLLDHFLVASSMAEVAANARVAVSGHCDAVHCKTTLTAPKAVKRLSDHCPLVLELANEDND